MHRLFTFSALLVVFVGQAMASPRDELASPVQSVRDHAAATLRGTYQEIPESKWRQIIDSIKVGQTREAVLQRLEPFHVAPSMGAGSGGSFSESYILDDGWMLTCWYSNKNNALLDRHLQRATRSVWVEPPKDFTGKWITYFINGYKNHEINYQAGRYFGEFMSFSDNGAKSVVQHYAEAGIFGEEIGYFPSGQLRYKGRYEDGKQMGKWVWYDEAGNLASTREQAGICTYYVTYSPEKPQELHGALFCNGSSLCVAFGQVVTPLGEFVGVKDASIGEWQQMEAGRKVVPRSTSAVSESMFLAGSFGHPPEGVGPEWFYMVQRNLWINPQKAARVDLE